MTIFHYKAIAADGKQVDGQMEASDAHSVIAELRSAGLLPISAAPKSSRLGIGDLSRRLQRWRTRVRRAEITAITRELATLLQAGIAIDGSLRILERHAREGGRLRAVLTRIHGDVQSGKPLSAALSAHGDCFDPLHVSLVRAGEASGALAVVMERLAVHRERTDAFNATLVSALTYPVVLVCVAAVSLIVLLTFVIPRFIPLFADAGESLPLLTEMVFGMARLLQGGWWLLLGAIVLAKVAADRWLARAGSRLRLDRGILRSPVVGEIVLLTEAVRFARTLATLLRNGLPLLTSLKHVRDVQRNSMVALAIDDAMDSVRGGRRLAAALERAHVFPDLAIEFITIGEESGRLEDMLEKVADTFQMRAEQRLKRLLTLLEPALILGLGAAIAIVIVSILLAMLGLNELVV